jgi:DNA-binding response OmpR family regulator/Tfp pilus assembly protein PilZ
VSEDPREHPRFEGTYHVQYKTVDELVLAYTADLSRGGMFLKTEDFLPINAVIQVKIELPEGAGEIPAICRVTFVRDRDAAAEAGQPMGMGLEFLDLTQEALQIFEHFIIELSGDAQPAQKAIARRLKVVAVDDDAFQLEHIAEVFRQRGDQVYTAADGFEGLALCLKQLPDVILCDVQMPRMDGWQFLRMVRARPSLAAAPVVFLTTLGNEADRLRGYQLGVDDYIAKPFVNEEVLARVDRLVNRLQRTTRPNIEKKTLRGDLMQVSLASVLSFLENEKMTGELLIVGKSRARLLLSDGKLLRTELNEPVPLAERPYVVLGWKRGQFEFVPQDIEADPGDTPLSLTGLILEHARRSDEDSR